MDHKPLWKGSRGEWYLVVQACLFLLLAFGPHTSRGVTAWSAPYTWIGTLGGGILLGAGILAAAPSVIGIQL